MFIWSCVLVVFLQFVPGFQECVREQKYSWCISKKACVEKHKVIFRDRCLSACPKWTHFFDNTTHTCYAECPVESVVSGSYCLSSATCTSKNEVVSNRTCVAACPVETPYIKDGICYKACPSSFIGNGSDCIDPKECTAEGHYITNTTCVKACPSETPFVKYGTCISTCTPDTVRNGESSCIHDQDCIQLNKVIHNGTCTDTCPLVAHHNVSGKCYARCPQGYILNDRHCITTKECTEKEKKLISDGTCVRYCPPEAPLLDEEKKTCFSDCPVGSVKLESYCISQDTCTDITQYYKLIFNGTCLEKCPESAQFIHERNCLTECPDDYVSNGTMCLTTDQCESVWLVYNGKCVRSCPDEAPIQRNQECVDSCSEYELLDDGNTCIDHFYCKKHIFNKTCVQICPAEAPFEHDKNCLTKCPSTSDYKFSVSYGFSGGKSTTVSDYMIGLNGTKCIDIVKCAEGGQFIFKETCINKCPPGTSIKSFVSSPWNHICYSLEETKKSTILSTSVFFLSFAIVLSLVYNPKRKAQEEKNHQPEITNVKDAQADASLDAVVIGEVKREREQRGVNNEQSLEEEESLLYQAEPDVRRDVRVDVDVHSDLPPYGEDVPLLPLDGNEVESGSNMSDDDALLFGNGRSVV